jgi:hypothetical protein
MEEESRARRERREYSGKGAQDGPRDVCEAAYVSRRQQTSVDVSKLKTLAIALRLPHATSADVQDAFVSMRQHTSACVSIRQHTSGALRMASAMSAKQHTSAFVSIRQQPSAFVSKRPHTVLLYQ